MHIVKKTLLALSASLALAGSAEAQQWGGRHHGGYGHHGSYDRGFGRHGGGGDVVAGIFGLAAGVIIAGALSANEEPRRVMRGGGNDWAAHCARRYRSYDAYSNTYMGYDGYRRACR